MLDPKNEEAMYLLMNIEIERSNFDKVEKLKKDFELICSSLCTKISSIDQKLKDFDAKSESFMIFMENTHRGTPVSKSIEFPIAFYTFLRVRPPPKL